MVEVVDELDPEPGAVVEVVVDGGGGAGIENTIVWVTTGVAPPAAGVTVTVRVTCGP